MERDNFLKMQEFVIVYLSENSADFYWRFFSVYQLAVVSSLIGFDKVVRL